MKNSNFFLILFQGGRSAGGCRIYSFETASSSSPAGFVSLHFLRWQYLIFHEVSGCGIQNRKMSLPTEWDKVFYTARLSDGLGASDDETP